MLPILVQGASPGTEDRVMTQVDTWPTTFDEIMKDPSFALGAADVRAGLPFRREYERWDTNTQWHYERGRAWALIAPRHVKIRGHDGKLNPNAVDWFRRAEEIL
jgi:hypothetical protein